MYQDFLYKCPLCDSYVPFLYSNILAIDYETGELDTAEFACQNCKDIFDVRNLVHENLGGYFNTCPDKLEKLRAMHEREEIYYES